MLRTLWPKDLRFRVRQGLSSSPCQDQNTVKETSPNQCEEGYKVTFNGLVSHFGETAAVYSQK